MTPTIRHRARSLAAALTLLMLLVGVPVLLVAIARWPLPTEVPNWERIRVGIVQGDVPADVVVRGLAVVVWFVWLQLAWATVWELAVNLPRVARGERSAPGPLVAPMVGAGVARLIALVFSITAMTSIAPAAALASTFPSTVIASDYVARHATVTGVVAAADDVYATPTEPVWMVVPGDSLWRIAETALGDGTRATEILDLNPFLQSPRDVRPGQTLRLPLDAAIPTERQEPPAPALEDQRHLSEIVVVIEPGDNLWNLSAARLVEATGRDPSDRDVRAYLDRVIHANADAIDDPNLIYPGEIFTFPAIGTETEPTRTIQTDTEVEPDPAGDPSRDRPPSAPSDDEAATASLPAAVNAPTVQATTTTPPTIFASPTAPTTTARHGSGAAEAGTSTMVRSGSGTDSSVPAIAGVTGALVLASGLLLAHRRHRMRVASTGASALRRSPSDADLDAALVAAADVSLLHWANHEMADAFAQLGASSAAAPIAVELSETHGIEILWDQPNPHAPRPWEATDGGWAWRTLYDPDYEIPAAAVAAPIPGLVTIGTRNGRQLLVDLEAFPTLTISGPETAVEDLIRSMLSELAVSETVADAYVRVVNLNHLVDQAFARVTGCDSDAARDLISTTVADHRSILERADLADTFQLRRVDGAGRALTVVVAPNTDLDDGTLGPVAPRHGVAALIVGERSDTSATITIDETGAATLEPLGISFTPAALPALTAARISELLTDEATDTTAAAETSETPPIADVPHEPPPEDISTNGHLPVEADESLDPSETEPWAPQGPRVMVRVLGPPDVPDYPSLGRLETSIVAFLACSGGNATDDQLIDAVWNGRLVERTTVWNRISKARAVLGHLLPQREQGSSKVTVHPDIGTDMDQLADILRYADGASTGEAIDLLAEGLELVRGVPFDAPGYDWAHQRQHHARACELVEAAGLRLAEIALEVSDLVTARSAVVHALRALPANEPLYRMRMRIEAASDNPSGVRSAYDELLSTLDEWGDGSPADPSPTTSRLYEDLTGSSARA